MNGIRVLFVSHTGAPGGSNEVVLSLLRHRPVDAYCECAFLGPGPVIAQAAALGVETHLIPSGRARDLSKIAGVVRALRVLLRERRFDVAFAHITKAHLYASMAARRERIPYLWWQHERRSQKPVMHAIAAWLPARNVICSSEWTANQQRTWRARATVHCVHPGIEVSRPLPEHEPPAGDDGSAAIGVVGRLQRWKRVELALAAMPHVMAADPAVQMRVIGGTTPGVDEGYDLELQALARELGIEDAVEFDGQVEDGAGEMRRLELLVHTADREPFGLVLLEAMLAGIPVVAVDEGGPREIVRDGRDGLLVPADERSIAEAIVDLLHHPERRAEMGAAGRSRVLEAFTAERMAREAWQIVRSAGADARAPARTPVRVGRRGARA